MWLENNTSEFDLEAGLLGLVLLWVSCWISLCLFPIWIKVQGSNQSYSMLWGLNEIRDSIHLEFCHVHGDHSINISYYCNCYCQNNPMIFSFFPFHFINKKTEIIKVGIIYPSSLSFEETKLGFWVRHSGSRTHVFNCSLVLNAVQIADWRTNITSFFWISPQAPPFKFY